MNKCGTLGLCALLFCAAVPTAVPVAAYNVMAPNSFDDADTRTYEYKAVVRMVKEGKSPKYTYEDMQIGRKLTRYEFAAYIIDLSDCGKNLDEKDLADLERAKKDYERELSARGWKEKREKKQPLLVIDGDFRVRHRSGEGGGNDARTRVGATYRVTETTTIHADTKVESDK